MAATNVLSSTTNAAKIAKKSIQETNAETNELGQILSKAISYFTQTATANTSHIKALASATALSTENMQKRLFAIKNVGLDAKKPLWLILPPVWKKAPAERGYKDFHFFVCSTSSSG